MQISRHYLTIQRDGKSRRVHYRRCGAGPALLMLHQSPRSSSEYAALMQAWGAHFTCIAPDMPGFGHSDPLAIDAPEIADFAAAIGEFCDASGLHHVPAFGFHSGAIILVAMMRAQPGRFSALALGGYAVWNDADRALIGDAYVPLNPPKAYGEHLVWLWNRILEQSWYFPWYAPDDATRLPRAHDDVAAVHSIILDMLNSGDAYRHGYSAVLRADRALPPPDATVADGVPPALITAYTGDPLKEHLARLGALPAHWQAYAVDTPADQHTASLAFLRAHSHEDAVAIPLIEDVDCGFIRIDTQEFSGLIHWHGNCNAKQLHIHAPGREGDLIDDVAAICIDMPGHGLSHGWADGWAITPPVNWPAYQAVIDAVAAYFGARDVVYDPLPVGDPGRLYPNLTPDRFGNYLTTAWSIVRASHIYAPWYVASAATAIPIDAASLDPAQLAREHRSVIRAVGAQTFHIAALKRI